MNPVKLVFTMLLFVFGASIMGVELVSSNLMSPYFGGSVYVWGSIIGTYMVAMSVGYVLGGWLARDSGRITPLLVLLALASLWIIALPWFYKPVSQAVSDLIFDPRYGSLTAMTLLIGLPILCMAMVSPYIIGLLAHHGQSSGLSAGVVMFVSTFGSFAGTILTSFYLVSWFRVTSIVHGYGAICLLTVLLAWLAGVDRHLDQFDREKADRENADHAGARRP